MSYLAKIKRLSDNIEEEVVLSIDAIDLTCFAALCPYEIEVEASYQVELSAQVFNEYIVHELEEGVSSSIVQIGDGFSHLISGRLNGPYLDACGILFEDDVLLSDFGYLEGKMVMWKVDRIDVEFL